MAAKGLTAAGMPASTSTLSALQAALHPMAPPRQHQAIRRVAGSILLILLTVACASIWAGLAVLHPLVSRHQAALVVLTYTTTSHTLQGSARTPPGQNHTKQAHPAAAVASPGAGATEQQQRWAHRMRPAIAPPPATAHTRQQAMLHPIEVLPSSPDSCMHVRRPGLIFHFRYPYRQATSLVQCRR